MKKIWMNTLAWALAALAAVVLALATPSESSVMGKLPSLTIKKLDQQHSISLPEDLPAERTLALIAFHGTHRTDVESWIRGLQLHGASTITWVRMPVLNDPGDALARSAVENRLLARYPDAGERMRVLPVFTDRAAFIRSAGLNGTDRVYAVVINRNGDVLARAEGEFDESKAEALRETLAH